MHQRFSSTVGVCLLIVFTTTLSGAQPEAPTQPYQKSVNTAVWNNGATTSSFTFDDPIWQIPVDKILVVEHVSARVIVNRGEKVTVAITCQSSGTVSVGLARHYLPLELAGFFDAKDRLVGTTPMRCYTTGNMLVTFTRNSTDALSVTSGTEFSITGYLIDAPK